MARWFDFLFGTPRGPQQDDDAKREVETQLPELDKRSAATRAALTEIQVTVLARRGDERD